jgi:hypothetical protein
MADTTPLAIGADATCTDGVGGKVSRLVIDPRAHTVTHLVVNDRQFQDRLVPLSLVDVGATTGKIRLRCTIAEFEKLDPASTTVPLQSNDTDPDNSYVPFPQVSKLLWVPPSATYDTLPAGEVAVRGGDHVHATDGGIGEVQGLVIDSGSHQVTQRSLMNAQLWQASGNITPGRRLSALPTFQAGPTGRTEQQHEHQHGCTSPDGFT